MTCSLANLINTLSIVTLPTEAPLNIAENICGVFPSRIKFLMAEFTTITSQAATRPFPDFLGRSCWDTTAFKQPESSRRICG